MDTNFTGPVHSISLELRDERDDIQWLVDSTVMYGLDISDSQDGVCLLKGGTRDVIALIEAMLDSSIPFTFHYPFEEVLPVT
jgi:hypothetical protein